MLDPVLDKAIIKYNEAQSIRKTYEQITKRLKDERGKVHTAVEDATHRASVRQIADELHLNASEAAELEKQVPPLDECSEM